MRIISMAVFCWIRMAKFSDLMIASQSGSALPSLGPFDTLGCFAKLTRANRLDWGLTNLPAARADASRPS